jgi:hypothetical protein
MPDPVTARRSQAHVAPVHLYAKAGTGLLLAALLLGGCASDNPMSKALQHNMGNLFSGPNEAGFLALVADNCGAEVVGGESVATLMDSDTTFRQLSARLFRGDISTDAFTNMLLQEYPAADANIPATGCVANQLNQCFNTRCDGRPAEPADDIAAADMVATRDEDLDAVPVADRDAVDAMIEEADREAAADIGPLPSEDPGILATETDTEIRNSDLP